jgi:hypothetical protein
MFSHHHVPPDGLPIWGERKIYQVVLCDVYLRANAQILKWELERVKV